MSEMSATEKLRAMLDERGIEHFDHENGEPLRKIEKAGEDPATSWQIDGVSYCAVPDRHGTFDVWIDHVTPEQAIAATVGAGTCKDLGGIGADDEVVFNCSECGCVLSVFDKVGNNNLCTSFIYDYPRFCPECGARVIEVSE